MSDPIVLVEPDPFIATGSKVAEFTPSFRLDTQANLTERAEKASEIGIDLAEIQNVSRPLNGIAVKPNTHAYVQVIQSDQTVVKVFNQLGMPLSHAQSGGAPGSTVNSDHFQRQGFGGNPPITTPAGGGLEQGFGGKLLEGLLGGAARSTDLGNGYNDRGTDLQSMGGMGIDATGSPVAQAWTDWILQSVRESRAEKTQLVETFGDSYLYAFGEKPRILAIQGLLMNTADYNWRAVFWENWDKFFRASKLIEMDARMYLGWEDIIVEGYPIQAQCSESASSPNALSFSFNMYVTNYFNVSMANRTAMLAQKKIYALGMSKSSSLSQPVNIAQVLDDRHNTFDKFMDLGSTVADLKYENGISADGWELDEEGRKIRKLNDFEMLIQKSARDLANQGSRIATGAHTTNSAQAVGFLNSYLLNLSFDATKFAMNAAQNMIETTTGISKAEQDAWFGYAGQLIENIALTSGASTFERWDPAASDNGANNFFTDAIRGGSIDRLVQRMGYQLVALNDLTGEQGKPNTIVGTDVAKGGYKQYGAHPGAATVLPLIPVDYGASTTSLSGQNLEAGGPNDPNPDPFGQD